MPTDTAQELPYPTRASGTLAPERQKARRQVRWIGVLVLLLGVAAVIDGAGELAAGRRPDGVPVWLWTLDNVVSFTGAVGLILGRRWGLWALLASVPFAIPPALAMRPYDEATWFGLAFAVAVVATLITLVWRRRAALT